MRILIAEDDQHIALIMQICLEKIGGHVVTCAADGEAALSKARTEIFDLLLLDGNMPKRSGTEVATVLRDESNETPVIFLSAKTDQRDVDLFLSLGRGYIAKPFDPQTVCQKIDTILAQTKKTEAKTG